MYASLYSIFFCYDLILLTCFCIVHTGANCVDGENNVVKVENIGDDNPFTINNATGGTYDLDGNPSCKGSRAKVLVPGQVKLLTGYINVSESLKLVNNSVMLLTIEKKSPLVGTVCSNGTSQNDLVTDDECQADLCAYSPDLCELLENVGVYTVTDLSAAGINISFVLPSAPSDESWAVKGKWHARAELQIGGSKTAFLLNVPSGHRWVDVDIN